VFANSTSGYFSLFRSWSKGWNEVKIDHPGLVKMNGIILKSVARLTAFDNSGWTEIVLNSFHEEAVVDTVPLYGIERPIKNGAMIDYCYPENISRVAPLTVTGGNKLNWIFCSVEPRVSLYLCETEADNIEKDSSKTVDPPFVAIVTDNQFYDKATGKNDLNKYKNNNRLFFVTSTIIKDEGKRKAILPKLGQVGIIEHYRPEELLEKAAPRLKFKVIGDNEKQTIGGNIGISISVEEINSGRDQWRTKLEEATVNSSGGALYIASDTKYGYVNNIVTSIGGVRSAEVVDGSPEATYIIKFILF
jgi:hypothetical protein